MNLQDIITYYKTENRNTILPLQEKTPKMEITKIVEEALKGNYHLSMVFSKNNKVSDKDFVLVALHVLEYNLYDISEALSNYSIKPFNYSDFHNEIWFPLTKEILKTHRINQENCITIHKL